MSTVVLMRLTVVAMLPFVVAQAAVYGGGVFWQLLLTTAAALLTEAACLRLRGCAVWRGLTDGGALITAVIIAVCLPPFAPWFVSVFAAATAIGVAKHCYGGLGNNPFNPAMAGYALAFISFPAHFGDWLSDVESWRAVFFNADAASAPTPLAAKRIGDLSATNLLSKTILLPGAACLLGGVFLLFYKIADWRLTVSFLLAAFCFSADESFLHGGVLFAAFFVITDPVTAAATPGGRLLYGFAAGALTMGLRKVGAHTDGIAFAVLICNLFAVAFDKMAALVWRWPR